jgi:hypothetical protein
MALLSFLLLGFVTLTLADMGGRDYGYGEKYARFYVLV